MSGRYLLDTHTFAWAVGDPASLSGTVRGLLEDPDNAVLLTLPPLKGWDSFFSVS